MRRRQQYKLANLAAGRACLQHAVALQETTAPPEEQPLHSSSLTGASVLSTAKAAVAGMKGLLSRPGKQTLPRGCFSHTCGMCPPGKQCTVVLGASVEHIVCHTKAQLEATHSALQQGGLGELGGNCELRSRDMGQAEMEEWAQRETQTREEIEASLAREKDRLAEIHRGLSGSARSPAKRKLTMAGGSQRASDRKKAKTSGGSATGSGKASGLWAKVGSGAELGSRLNMSAPEPEARGPPLVNQPIRKAKPDNNGGGAAAGGGVDDVFAFSVVSAGENATAQGQLARPRLFTRRLGPRASMPRGRGGDIDDDEPASKKQKTGGGVATSPARAVARGHCRAGTTGNDSVIQRNVDIKTVLDGRATLPCPDRVKANDLKGKSVLLHWKGWGFTRGTVVSTFKRPRERTGHTATLNVQELHHEQGKKPAWLIRPSDSRPGTADKVDWALSRKKYSSFAESDTLVEWGWALVDREW
jgi:hypothetical protein